MLWQWWHSITQNMVEILIGSQAEFEGRAGGRAGGRACVLDI